jgi:hypothetical protein
MGLLHAVMSFLRHHIKHVLAMRASEQTCGVAAKREVAVVADIEPTRITF